jgi:transcriptional regulator with XRE-family HTH domain
MEIGTKIKSAREKKGYSQEKMADILGISQSKYCRLENNKAFIDWNKLPLLAETLELNLSDLFPNENKYFYFHKPNNQSGYIENQKNYDDNHLKKIEELYQSLLDQKDKMYKEIIKEKNELIESLKNKN